MRGKSPAGRSGRRSLTYVAIATVEDSLVAAAVLADPGQRLDDAQTELLPLLALVHGDILDMPHTAESTQELAFDEDSADRDDTVRRFVNDDNGVVCAGSGAQRFELGKPRVLTRGGDDSENRKH